MKNDPQRDAFPKPLAMYTDFLIDSGQKAGSAESTFNALFKKSFELIKFCDDGGEKSSRRTTGEQQSFNNFPPRQECDKKGFCSLSRKRYLARSG
jgi:hypothetical protein